MTQKTILLFDLDGVLVHPRGYQRALSDTVGLIGAALGYVDVQLPAQLIDRIEAVGLTSEWDSSAVCVALMLTHAWPTFPELRFPQTLPLEPSAPHHLPPPDFDAFITAVGSMEDDRHARERAAERLLQGSALTGEQRQTLQMILESARDPQRSLSFQVFQELILGSEGYTNTYKRPAHLHRQSYLISYDQCALSAQDHRRLLNWLARAEHDASIFTNRPSPWPDSQGGTPEAQLGARVCGLESLPIVAYGELTWLSARVGRPMDAFIKPSPVHVLAGLLSAGGIAPAASVEEALHLVRAGGDRKPWRTLDGAQVFVFEDSAKGLQSAQAAQDLLISIEIRVEMQLCGITQGSAKTMALEQAGARLFSDVGEALRTVPGF